MLVAELIIELSYKHKIRNTYFLNYLLAALLASTSVPVDDCCDECECNCKERVDNEHADDVDKSESDERIDRETHDVANGRLPSVVHSRILTWMFQ